MHRFGHGHGYGSKSRRAFRRKENSDGRRTWPEIPATAFDPALQESRDRPGLN